MSSKTLADSLKVVLADTFVLYFKTHSFHWNVTGPHFKSLHEMFEEQYTETEDLKIERDFKKEHWFKTCTLLFSGI